MSPSNPIQDIAPAKPAIDTNLVEPEIEHSIPVKHPDSVPGEQKNPVAPEAQFAQGQPDNDAEFDHILKDVNQQVKKEDSQKSAPSHRFSFFKKRSAVKPAAKGEAAKTQLAQSKAQRPILIAIVAAVVASALTTAAIYAFKPPKNTNTTNNTNATDGKVGTSDSSSDTVQANGGTLVQPGDLTDLSNSLQSKINGLNDAQDFNQNDLSDQNLGL